MFKLSQKIFIIFILIFSFSFIFFQVAKAFCDFITPCGGTCTYDTGNDDYDGYKCSGTCGGTLKQKVCDIYQDYICSCGGTCWIPMGNPYDTNCTDVFVKNCQPWEKCDAGSGSCKCGGECLDKTTGPLIWNGYAAQTTSNVFLPLSFSWNPVAHANGYKYRVWNAAEGEIINKRAQSTSATPTEDVASCIIKSNDSYNWQVVPCCDAAGSNCKPWADVFTWNFTTNLAPEPVSPADPDWNSTNSEAQNINPFPVTLDWCDVENAKYYELKLYIINGGAEICHPWLEVGGVCKYELISPKRILLPTPHSEPLLSEFTDDVGFFTKDTSYRWEVSVCTTENTSNCSDYSQKWGFGTDPNAQLPHVELLAPPAGSMEGFPLELKWKRATGTNSFIYKYRRVPGGWRSGTTTADSVTFLPGQLILESSYRWKVTPCWDYSAKKCEGWEDPNANGWIFITTGWPPNLISPPDDAAATSTIPVKLDWSDVVGAASYEYRIATDRNFNTIVSTGSVNLSEISIDYPILKLDTNYYWRVKTCSDAQGVYCGTWSNGGNAWKFKTFQLAKPINPSPADGSNVAAEERMITLKWDPVLGAKVYQYEIYWGGNKVKDEIVSSPGQMIFLQELNYKLGTYEWRVRACLDINCNDPDGTGPWSSDGGSKWSFNLIQLNPQEKGGLVPCGRTTDDPSTPWNETDSCQIKHLFLLVRSVLEFAIFQIGLIMWVLLIIAIGVYFLISHGDTTVIDKAKSIIKSLIIGYLLIFGAWFFINLFLASIGFQFGLFGHWWEIKF